MSYLSYITNHYQNARNIHTNATKDMKYIQRYRYKKTASISDITQNERQQKTPGKYFIL